MIEQHGLQASEEKKQREVEELMSWVVRQLIPRGLANHSNTCIVKVQASENLGQWKDWPVEILARESRGQWKSWPVEVLTGESPD